ncbi:MAG TPA: protein translocase subunit SecF [Campylobacterales bacterium]|nr:protein translocase subunit SecF [Campylobacterales bacterium]
MELFRFKNSYDFMGKSKIFLSLSLTLMVSSLLLLWTKGLNFGIDFAGGTLIQVKYQDKAPISAIREAVSQHELFQGASITEFGSPDEIVIRIKKSSGELKKDIGDEVAEILRGTGEFQIRRVDMVGAKVGGELREKGITALILVVISILIYLSFRFEWRFALASIFALIHDVTIALGAISLFEIEVNLDTLAAILTILGYSLNDTIIVFDRIREGLVKFKNISLAHIINESVSRTLSRTTLTSLTTFFVVFTLFLFGGEIIHGFSFTLLVGIVVGTYSSIFIASPTLIWFRFSVEKYRKMLAEKEKREREKERMREMYEKGVL